jgi:hypothetical protein
LGCHIGFYDVQILIKNNATNNASAKLDQAAARIRDAAAGVENTAGLYEDVDTFLATNQFGGGK